jgi:hypothetical protein
MIDELISFPHRREQLMRKGAISKVVKMVKPIRDNDQYIIPESSLTWTELLRLEWLTKPFDRPTFYEEMSREGDDEKSLGQLPTPLENMFGTASSLYLYIPEEQTPETPFESIASIIGVPLTDIKLSRDAQTLTADNIIEYVRQTHKPIGFIDIDANTEYFAKEDASTFRKVLVIVRVNNKIGVLLENNNDNYIMINLLPEKITDNWVIVESQPAPAVYPEARPKGLQKIISKGLRKIGAPAIVPVVVPAAAPVKKGIAKVLPKSAIKEPVAPSLAPAIEPAVESVKKGIAKIGAPIVKAPTEVTTEAVAPATVALSVAPATASAAVIPSMTSVKKGIAKIQKKNNTLRRSAAAEP